MNAEKLRLLIAEGEGLTVEFKEKYTSKIDQDIIADALREALVNALIHRDYSMRGTNISVNIFDDRVEIVNPGGLPSGINKENFGKESVRRNLITADLFHRMSKVERIGSGIGRMRNLMKEADLQEPVFESDTFFRAIFYRNPEYALKRDVGKGEEGGQTGGQRKDIALNDTQKKILKILTKKPHISRNELVYMIGINPSAIQKHFKKLQESGYIRRVGPDFGGHWEVVN